MREMIAIDDRLDVFSRFGLDRSHGFVCGIERGATRLPAGFEAWEGLAARLPEELTLGLLRSSVQRVCNLLFAHDSPATIAPAARRQCSF